jgi:hypothetical protein
LWSLLALVKLGVIFLFRSSYAKVKVSCTSPASVITQDNAEFLRLKEEVKFLYKQKDHLNWELLAAHLQAVKEWGNIWTIISDSIHHSLRKVSEHKYQVINKKLQKLDITQPNTHKEKLQFYPQVVNNTNIQFTNAEITLLNKGLKYKLHHKQSTWIRNLTWEAEATVTQLPDHDQDHIRPRIAHTIDKLYKKQNNVQFTHKMQQYHERTLLKQRKQKLDIHCATITKADKGNSLVIIYQQDYDLKVQTFINNNSFSVLHTDLTQKFRDVRKGH